MTQPRIAVLWDDLRTDDNSGCTGYPGDTCGVYTSVSGTAPNRVFNIEWRAVYMAHLIHFFTHTFGEMATAAEGRLAHDRLRSSGGLGFARHGFWPARSGGWLERISGAF